MSDVCEGSDLICNVLDRCSAKVDVLCWEGRRVNGRVPEIDRKHRRLLKIERRSQNIEGLQEGRNMSEIGCKCCRESRDDVGRQRDIQLSMNQKMR